MWGVNTVPTKRYLHVHVFASQQESNWIFNILMDNRFIEYFQQHKIKHVIKMVLKLLLTKYIKSCLALFSLTVCQKIHKNIHIVARVPLISTRLLVLFCSLFYGRFKAAKMS